MDGEGFQQPRAMIHHARDWTGGVSGPSSGLYTQTPSSMSQRRRSSAAHTRPAAPPPNLPIPSIPDFGDEPLSPTQSPALGTPHEIHDGFPITNGSVSRPAFVRPIASPNLAAVAAFSQSRVTNAFQHQSPPLPSPDDLSDPPPPSILPPPPSASRIQQPSQQPPSSPDGLLSPRSPTNRPPSSRRALTRALELAREAVQLDATNEHPEEAVIAYGRSVALLSEVMERVRRGESSEVPSRRRNGRRRSPEAQEEEIRRLQNIHDTYADRMNILCISYNIPPVPYSTESLYASITSSGNSVQSPTDEPEVLQLPYANPITDTDITSLPQPDTHTTYPTDPEPESYGQSSILSDLSGHNQQLISGLPIPSSHPYAAAVPYESQAQTTLPNRASVQIRRARGSSAALPPALPPPQISPPPAPTNDESSPELANRPSDSVTRRSQLDAGNRPWGELVSHKRSNSASKQLESLEEETDRYSYTLETKGDGDSNTLYLVPTTPRKQEMPLPAIPSPTSSSGHQGTVKSSSSSLTKPPPSPKLASPSPNIIVPRPRGSSHSVINPSINQGSILQRRSKTSTPSTPRSSSPSDSIGSASSNPVLKPGPGMGRSRSSSQPGRRPSIISGRISPTERPPLPPNSANINGIVNQGKFSRGGPLPLQLTVHTDIPAALSLAPPNSLPALPTTPVSPLPPLAPSDSVRKPYYLMNLLRITMTSSTGGYLTRRLHVPLEVWSQGGAKLNNSIEKIRVVGILCSALEDLQVSSSEYFGAGNVSSGMALGIGSIGRKEGEAWTAKLEDFSQVCDGVVSSFGKKLGVGEGFMVKKTTWSDKLSRRFDKFTNGKNLDSPTAYVEGLKRLFMHTQLLEEHTRAVTSQPIAPAYASFPVDIRNAAESKLRHSSEFFATVVLTFVISDLSQLLDKYVKKCEKWMAE